MKRVAIYAQEDVGEDLVRCARYARRAGGRIVTIASKLADDAAGVESRLLGEFLDRMQSGEFDTILAAIRSGEGRRTCASQPALVRVEPVSPPSSAPDHDNVRLIRFDRVEGSA